MRQAAPPAVTNRKSVIISGRSGQSGGFSFFGYLHTETGIGTGIRPGPGSIYRVSGWSEIKVSACPVTNEKLRIDVDWNATRHMSRARVESEIVGG